MSEVMESLGNAWNAAQRVNEVMRRNTEQYQEGFQRLTDTKKTITDLLGERHVDLAEKLLDGDLSLERVRLLSTQRVRQAEYDRRSAALLEISTELKELAEKIQENAYLEGIEERPKPRQETPYDRHKLTDLSVDPDHKTGRYTCLCGAKGTATKGYPMGDYDLKDRARNNWKSHRNRALIREFKEESAKRRAEADAKK